MYVLFCDKQID